MYLELFDMSSMEINCLADMQKPDKYFAGIAKTDGYSIQFMFYKAASGPEPTETDGAGHSVHHGLDRVEFGTSTRPDPP
jgi:hypothetical protein